MMADRNFEILAVWPTGSPGRENDIAEITVKSGEYTLSRVVDVEKQTSRDFFRASSTAVGLWFADNWWRLRWETLWDPRYPSVEWRLRHELNSALGGTLWPPLMIYSLGNRVILAPSIGNRPVAGPQSYLDFPVRAVAAYEYEAATDAFLTSVIETCANSVDGKALAAVMRQIGAERTDPELAGWRRLEACLGFDPDQAPEAVVNALIDLEVIAGEEGVEEAARSKPGADAPKMLEAAIDATRESPLVVDFELAYSITKSPDLPASASPWRFAEEAAAQLRRIIGVPAGPLKRDAFADLFRARWSDLKHSTATARKLTYGARLEERRGQERLALQTPSNTHDRRFELARHFGDRIWTAGSDFGIVSRSRTDRQKFQRAFALSLLCPFSDLREKMNLSAPTEDQIAAAAREFRVHVNVVRSLLVYKGVLNAETLDERLEAA